MQTIDVAIAVMAAVAVGGSAVGLALYEPDAAPAYVLRFEEHEVAGTSTAYQQSLSGGAERAATWGQRIVNVTRITLDLAIAGSGPRAQATIVEFTIQPPNASQATKRILTLDAPNDGTARQQLELTFASLPREMEVAAGSPAEAVAMGPVDTAATGDWRISARITQNGASVLGQVGGETVQATVTPQIVRYDSHAEPKVPEVAGSA